MPQSQLAFNIQLDIAAALDPKIKSVIEGHGYPEPRSRLHGFETMLRIIVSQQLSTKVAAVIWGRVEALCNNEVSAQVVLTLPEDALRECGLSWQKVGYAKGLAERIDSGLLSPEALADMPTDEAIKALIEIKGYGVWSAEIYAMFALERADIFPAGDLALQIAVQRLDALAEKPTEKQTREIAKRWSPQQSAVAVLMWHYYGATTLS
jgi:DNA-3-methyladenine glycosylase II